MFLSFKYVERINLAAADRSNMRLDLAISYIVLFVGTLFRRLVVQTDKVCCLISGPEGNITMYKG